MAKEGSAEATIRDIRRKTRRKYSAEEKIRIVIEGLRGEQSVAWHPDGDYILVSTDTGAWLYTPDLQDLAHLPEAQLAALSPDGRYIAGVDDTYHARLWDAHTLEPVDSPDTGDIGYFRCIRTMAWSPDGRYLAVSGSRNEDRLYVWDVRSRDTILAAISMGCFDQSLKAVVRDIESHLRGQLFPRLIECGPLNPDNPENAPTNGLTTLSDLECGQWVEFIFSHMINRFKSELAELLAIQPCLEPVRELPSKNTMPSHAGLSMGDMVGERCQLDAGSAGAEARLAS